MDTLIRRCCIDLYRASQDINGESGDFNKIYNEETDTVPYDDYFISGYKLHEIIREYMKKAGEMEQAFADIIYMKYAPNASAEAWRRKLHKNK